MNRHANHTSARPSCGEGEGLVRIGLKTASASTGFEASRRDLLAMMGFSLGAGALGGCRAPTQQALPLPVASDQIVPGVGSLYATTCGGCAAACSLVVKQRDGRPIKIEGNEASPLTGGGTCATGQATVLSLYDDARLRAPEWMGRPASWADIDARIRAALASTRGDRRKLVLLSDTIHSPSLRAILDGLRAAHPGFRHVVHDPMSLSALAAACEQGFGARIVPHYRFDRARVIVALDADFLGTWLSPVEFARQYAAGRTKNDRRSFHVQCEAGMSVSGSNADLRVAVAPSDLGAFALALFGAVARRLGSDGGDDELGEPTAPPHPRAIDTIADALVRHRGESLVVSGSDDPATQTIVLALNARLGNVGTTVDVARPSLQRQGDDAAVAALIDDMQRGDVHTLILLGANPVYDHPNGAAFANALKKVPLSISFADRRDETAAHVHALCPDHNFLESWGDAEPVVGHFSLRQPLIAPLHDTRAAAESLLAWSAPPASQPPPSYLEYLRAYWRRELFPRQSALATFDAFWDTTLQRGVAELPAAGTVRPRAFRGDWKAAARQVLADRRNARAALGLAAAVGRPSATPAYELQIHESVSVRDGRHTNNPWLLELPDPLTRQTWGNVAAFAPATAAALGLASGDVVFIATETGKVEAPVFVQPGQEPRTISIAVGYGRWASGKAGDGVGVNAYPLAPVAGGVRRRAARAIVTGTGRRAPLALAQTQLSMEGRPIVQTTTVAALEAREKDESEQLPDLWRERLKGEHAWGMSIDLDACTGCSACVVACQAENNVPVVGADQIRRTRIMHWLRIDRYYEDAGDDVRTVHQPMMCQHCQHAPCETVCPVLATTTSSEGINQQVYNRCIGTRYCANNCPYKVRRFNWHNYTANTDFDFNMTSPLGRLVLNPDVTVRSRGVMEKCNLCVQRIQLAKNQALQERRAMRDGDVQTACQQACPTGAIVFGDLAHRGSRLAARASDRRSYRVLEDLGTRPNVTYLKKVERT